MNELSVRVGKKLRNIREHYGYTMREVGERIGINYSYIGKIEKGKIPSLDVLEKLCNLYKIEIASLLGDGIEVPKELKQVGVEWIAFAEDMEKENLTPNEIRKILDFVDIMKKRKLDE